MTDKATMHAATSATRPTVLVFDWLVRLTHWFIALGIALAWFTRHARGSWHEWLGYAVAAALLVRLIWGLIGSPHARFRDFVRGPRATLRYSQQWLGARAPRYLGHNPLAAWMILAIWSSLSVVLITGWMFTTDRWFGIEWVITAHERATWVLLGLIPLHLLGVLLASWRERENLPASMIHGHKRQS